jgi:hypothetical protein
VNKTIEDFVVTCLRVVTAALKVYRSITKKKRLLSARAHYKEQSDVHKTTPTYAECVRHHPCHNTLRHHRRHWLYETPVFSSKLAKGKLSAQLAMMAATACHVTSGFSLPITRCFFRPYLHNKTLRPRSHVPVFARPGESTTWSFKTSPILTGRSKEQERCDQAVVHAQ